MINLSEAAHNSKAVFVHQCVYIDVLITNRHKVNVDTCRYLYGFS